MESELERFNKQNTQLELNITELRQKLKATDKEMHQERQRVGSIYFFMVKGSICNMPDKTFFCCMFCF